VSNSTTPFIAAPAAFALLALAAPTAAVAQTQPAQPASARTIQVTPILDARARFEHAEQNALDGDALTVRLRAGAEARLGPVSLLVEGEGTLALLDDYNAFPFAIASGQSRPGFAVIADPENAEINRLQLQYRTPDLTVTLGRQRINLDDQRWVGSVGWRQNEQTFDAARAEGRLGPVTADVAYSISQRTIFGDDAGPRRALDGDFLFAGLGSRVGPVQGKLFAYLLDYDEAFALANSSQTYGFFVGGSVPVARGANLALRVSYARQSDYGANPFDYAADYWSAEGSVTAAGFTLAAGWEQLGSDNGRAVQTPMATLHKFNGWADVFLTTPPAGLQDAYVSASYRSDRIGFLPGLQASVAYHRFDSAVGGLDYGSEWDASLGFRVGRVNLLAKFADYDADGFGADTRRFWLQAEWAF
jgi:hypothetical protein